jgi:hypothetical protein
VGDAMRIIETGCVWCMAIQVGIGLLWLLWAW